MSTDLLYKSTNNQKPKDLEPSYSNNNSVGNDTPHWNTHNSTQKDQMNTSDGATEISPIGDRYVGNTKWGPHTSEYEGLSAW